MKWVTIKVEKLMSEGSSWSRDAYEITLQLRTSRTVLVEGQSDKSIIERILMEHELGQQRIVVDTAEMFSGGEFSGLGNRSKILKLIYEIDYGRIEHAKFFALIDREWNDLLDTRGLCSEWTEQTSLSEFCFQTLGHSVENYGFVLEFIVDYLKYFGDSLYSDRRRELIESRFFEILRFSAAFSLAMAKMEVIGRCNKIVCISDVTIGDRIELLPSFFSQLASRGVGNLTAIAEEIETHSDHLLSFEPRNLQYLCHGHIGDEVIWACVGRILYDDGAELSLCRDLLRGRRLEKERFFGTWLAKVPSNDRRPIDVLVHRLKTV